MWNDSNIGFPFMASAREGQTVIGKDMAALDGPTNSIGVSCLNNERVQIFAPGCVITASSHNDFYIQCE